MYIKGIFFFFFYSLILLKVLSIGHFLVEDISRHELSSMNLAGPTNQELPNLYSFRFRYAFELPTFISGEE